MFIPVISISGPTSIGKSSLSMRLAEEFNIEIISMDSVQVYKHFDIGSAKQCSKNMELVRHHLIDIISPYDVYSVMEFYSYIHHELKNIISRNKIPIIIGGTMFYLYASINYTLSALPPKSSSLRATIYKKIYDKGLESVYTDLQNINPESASSINPNDTQRIIRALEINMSTDKPTEIPELNYIKWFNISLAPDFRDNIHKNIRIRLEEGFDNGMLEEVVNILKLYPKLDGSYNSMRSINYRQIYSYLQGDYKTLEETKDRCCYAINQYAKRQSTWVRKMNNELNIYELNPLKTMEEDLFRRILKDIKIFLNQFN